PKRGPVTQRAPFDPQAPAQQALRWEMGEVRPAMVLFEGGDRNLAWQPRRDLLASDRFAREFVLEVAEDGRSQLRFGDDVLGQAPTPGVPFEALYRVGNGAAGNVGAEAIAHLVQPLGLPAGGILRVRNPLPAAGGLEPEGLEAVRQYAPQAFRRQERAVTEADYAEVAQRHPEVQKAAATFRWTGSWYTVFVSVDRKGGRPVDAAFERELLGHLERFRMAGYDLEIDGPRFVPVDLALEVCVAAGHFRSGVKAALLEAFSTRELPTGPAFFHPDRFSFGDPLYLSQVYRQALAVPGVASVEVRRFRRFGKTPARELEEGVLATGRLEVIRLDNDPSRPEFGRLELTMKGGL
ncbi:putative baseplate assembly protein, partial [Calidithermus roseus]